MMRSAREFKLPFGKYKGETLEEVYVENVGYLEWLLEEYKKRSGNRPNEMVSKIEGCMKEMRQVKIY